MRIEQLPAAEYHAREGLGGTSIAAWPQLTPKAWKHRRDNGIRATDFMERGTLAHTLILEPEEMDHTHYVMGLPHGRRSNADKIEWEEFALANKGKVIVTSTALPEEYGVTTMHPDGFQAAFDAAKLIREDQDVYAMVRRGHTEVSYFVEHPELGIPLKARLDWEGTVGAGAAAMDLKGTNDLSDRALKRKMIERNIPVQAAHYENVVEWVTGTRPRQFFLLWVLNGTPVDFRVARIDPDDLEAGRRKAERAYREIAECMASNVWPGHPRRIDTLSLPSWYGEDHPGSEEEGEAA